jgi:hypothetical protein
MKRAAILMTVLGVLLFAAPAAADSLPLPLRFVSETSATVTVAWDPPTGAVAYTFWVGGERVSNSQDGQRSSTKFKKATCNDSDDCYMVVAHGELARGGYPHRAACSNKKDDDGDGLVDLADPGCTNPSDTDETDAPPPPPPPTTITSSQCAQRASVSGALIQNVTVTGGCNVGGTSVTLDHVTVQGIVALANGTHLQNSTAMGFSAFGADNWVVENNVLDGQGRVDQNIWWDAPAGNAPDNWVIRGNTIKNFYDAANPSNHSEGLYVGYSTNGLIENNTFTNNGNTSHIFFTWFGNTANPATSYPRNICVRGNVFGPTHGAYFDVNFREEIPASANIKIQLDASNTNPQFYGAC